MAVQPEDRSMANITTPIDLKKSERKKLEQLWRSSSARAAVSRRARAILLMADNVPGVDIARQTGFSPVQVSRLRQRFAKERLEGIEDKPRSGRPREVNAKVIARIVGLTLKPPPKGLTHWTTRDMAQKTGLSHTTIQRIWKAHGLKPHRVETFKFTTDPEAEEKIRDIVGLYLNPPSNAAVLCIDEKTQIQALDRTQPLLPLRPGLPARQTHDYRRNGLTSLYAALDVARGKVVGECSARHTALDFLRFLKKVARRFRGELHVILDNSSTHKTPEIRQWLDAHPRVHFHFTPTGASWMNMIEVWFGILTRKSVRRGSFRNVRQLIRHIQAFIEAWNENASPFAWTKGADDIVRKAVRH
jgi:transposase